MLLFTVNSPITEVLSTIATVATEQEVSIAIIFLLNSFL
jgi:hypothetical protein